MSQFVVISKLYLLIIFLRIIVGNDVAREKGRTRHCRALHKTAMTMVKFSLTRLSLMSVTNGAHLISTPPQPDALL